MANYNISPEKSNHKFKRNLAAVTLGVVVLGGAASIGDRLHSDAQKTKANNEFFQTDKTIHHVTDFEPHNAIAIAEGMGALDVNQVAKEITAEIGSTITSGEMIKIPNDELKTPDHKRF